MRYKTYSPVHDVVVGSPYALCAGLIYWGIRVMTIDLEELYRECAIRCRDEGIANDDSPFGAIHCWVISNVRHRSDTAFYIVLGISGAMADLDAQFEGFTDQLDRAAKKAFSR